MRVAIIDIGSNAIRTVVYDDNKLGASEIYNEKFKSDVFSLLEHADLSEKNSTYNIFSYYNHIFHRLNVTKITCVATEVLRNHSKADEFIEQIKQRFNIEIKVLTGEDEAKLAAIGLISSIPDADGIAADLGGGSLELAEVYKKSAHKVVSLPLGTKILSNHKIDKVDSVKAAILDEFEYKKCKNLYLIGGALRLIGRCYMDYSHNIVKNLHSLVIEPERFSSFLSKLDQTQKYNKFFNKYKINKYGILVLKALIEIFKPENLIFSTYGLKEGVRFNMLPNNEKSNNLVAEKSFNMCKDSLVNFDKIKYLELFRKLDLKFSDQYEDLFLVALALSQNTKNIDRNYKDESIVNFLLSTDIPFNQLQRSILTVALSNCFATKEGKVPLKIKKILNKVNYNYAEVIGSLLKTCFLVDGPIISSPSFGFNLNNNFLEINTIDILPRSTFEKIFAQIKNIGILRRSINNTEKLFNN